MYFRRCQRCFKIQCYISGLAPPQSVPVPDRTAPNILPSNPLSPTALLDGPQCAVESVAMQQPSAAGTVRAWLLSALVVHAAVAGNPDAKRLYDDLLSNYNKLVRPVVNTSDVLRVCIKLKLSQLIDVVRCVSS
ncbi:unnamed protein product [Psylliodes chrysocephalus]|uniref:Neurotransmitter-gated ion-channel ligand-binding domain-containing protein n=1 Tax=Psylliodes chrysocephalus TaxID=3402493 RepID=A0A9P0C9S4_9CUCU|nr:unnamed protein product [Psylliodes chrysocephala]